MPAKQSVANQKHSKFDAHPNGTLQHNCTGRRTNRVKNRATNPNLPNDHAIRIISKRNCSCSGNSSNFQGGGDNKHGSNLLRLSHPSPDWSSYDGKCFFFFQRPPYDKIPTRMRLELAATETDSMFFFQNEKKNHQREGQGNKMNQIKQKRHSNKIPEILKGVTFRTIWGSSTCNVPSTSECSGAWSEDHWTIFAFTETIQPSSKDLLIDSSNIGVRRNATACIYALHWPYCQPNLRPHARLGPSGDGNKHAKG